VQDRPVALEDVVKGLVLLEERFNRSVSKELAAAYYAIMAEEGLTVSEWAAATKAAFRYSTFWPSPQELIEYARGATEAAIEDDWLKVARLGSGGTLDPKELSEAGNAALQSLGGYVWVRDNFHPSMRERFYNAWKANAARKRLLQLGGGGSVTWSG